jgi:hypothetical protein
MKIGKNLEKKSVKISIPVKNGDNEKGQVSDPKRRNLLKAVGGVGLVSFLLTFFPTDKAEALVLGGTPSNSIVGMKNSSNTRINPATEETLSGIKTNIDKLQFDGSNNLMVASSSSGGEVSGIVGIEDSASNQINPASEEGIVYLRRLVKLMDSQAVVDSNTRQRITLDSWGSLSTGTGTSTGCARVAIGTDSTVGVLTSIGSWDARQMFQDQAHNVYANSIRRNLTFN